MFFCFSTIINGSCLCQLSACLAPLLPSMFRLDAGKGMPAFKSTIYTNSLWRGTTNVKCVWRGRTVNGATPQQRTSAHEKSKMKKRNMNNRPHKTKGWNNYNNVVNVKKKTCILLKWRNQRPNNERLTTKGQYDAVASSYSLLRSYAQVGTNLTVKCQACRATLHAYGCCGGRVGWPRVKAQ